MSESLEDRLRDHAQAFDGLLSLIPARVYYGEDTSDQWKKKKQTKEEARAAKLAKLNPDNAKSALDIMQDNARKRKREETEDSSEIGDVALEQPKEGLKPAKRTENKKKKENGQEANQDESHGKGGLETSSSRTAGTKSEKRKAKKESKKVKAVIAAETAKRPEDRDDRERPLAEGTKMEGEGGSGGKFTEETQLELDPEERLNLTERLPTQVAPRSSASTSPGAQSPIFDAANTKSGTSSTSSVNTSATTPPHPSKSISETSTPKTISDEAKARLLKRIDELRAARKADREGGASATTRQELIEMRRKKEEQRKAHKKELRKEAKEDERKQREGILSSASPLLSPSLMSPHGSHGSAPLSEPTNNFSYGRLVFDNGLSTTAGLDAVIDNKKKRGPRDPKTALQAAENHLSKVASLDPATRADIQEKDMWLSARKRAHGERVRDDSSLLKKTLKRKEKMKKKSEKDWGERLESIAKGQATKQKKREDNLRKRKEEKGKKGKKSKGGKGAKSSKPKARPGFEGSFRAGGRRQ